ncbi:mitochondrial ribosomal protein S21 [Nomia melanderi]|uniref:mitochondrial ribosomal protein S21 n=1 Tax=Nomia melanderi TaxID=2448451 RepID=UPI00130438AA|nr:28S ribosomal protein S21, mitochondrial [Nomia melanderi]
MVIPKHAQFISRTVMVLNKDVEQACRRLNYIMAKEGFFQQFRRTRYYEKPTQTRRRVNYEKCKAIYNEDMSRKIKFLMRTNREDPWPGCSSL